jgi:hypothetical protein
MRKCGFSLQEDEESKLCQMIMTNYMVKHVVCVCVFFFFMN